MSTTVTVLVYEIAVVALALPMPALLPRVSFAVLQQRPREVAAPAAVRWTR